MAFRPLFRFFHEGLTPGRQDTVQDTLCAVVREEHADYRIRDMHRQLWPFLPDGHPMKKHMSRLAAGLRGDGMTGRKFALECLIAARLPGVEDRILRLSQAALPAGMAELVRYYRNLLLGMS